MEDGWETSKAKGLREAVAIARAFVRELQAQAGEHALPPALGRKRAAVEQQRELNVDETGRVLGPFQVPAHPVKAVGYA